jgi:hypothetical protein
MDFIALLILFLVCCIAPVPIYYIIRRIFSEGIRGE